jgi:hypothetical protein
MIAANKAQLAVAAGLLILCSATVHARTYTRLNPTAGKLADPEGTGTSGAQTGFSSGKTIAECEALCDAANARANDCCNSFTASAQGACWLKEKCLNSSSTVKTGTHGSASQDWASYYTGSCTVCVLHAQTARRTAMRRARTAAARALPARHTCPCAA